MRDPVKSFDDGEATIDFAGDLVGRAVSKGSSGLDYVERLRNLAINGACLAENRVDGAGGECRELDSRTLALVRLAALVAVGGAGPSYGAETDAALSAGATAVEIVDMLVGIVPIIGLPRVVKAAPKVAMALGFDTDDALGPDTDW